MDLASPAFSGTSVYANGLSKYRDSVLERVTLVTFKAPNNLGILLLL